jgi:hypothetical protein
VAITNQERVGKAMELLRAGLAPFVEREFKSHHTRRKRPTTARALLRRRPRRRQEAHRRMGRGGAAQADVGSVERRLRQDRSAAPSDRSCRSCAIAATSGHTRSRSRADDTDRALDSMVRLLTAISAPEADEVDKHEARAATADDRGAGAWREAQDERLADRRRRRPARSSRGARS